MITVLIAGVQIAHVLQSVTVDLQANGRDTAQFQVTNTQSYSNITYGTQFPEAPQVGQTVMVKWGSTILFSGTIDTIDVEHFGSITAKGQTQYQSSGWAVKWTITAVDFNQIADRHFVTATFENVSFQYIVNALVNTWLAQDGVSVAAGMPVGPILQRVVYSYVTVAEAFNELSKLTGYVWNIDYARVLQWSDPAGTASFFTFVQSNIEFGKISVSRDQFRNVQAIVGGRDIAGAQTDSFKGDGATKTYALSLAVAKVPTVTVNAVGKTVGIKQVDSGKDWYWSEGDNVIEQDNGAAALASTDTLAVTFQGFVPIYVEMESASAISQRQQVEGGSGRYASIETDESLENLQLAIDKCSALLRTHSRIAQQLNIRSTSQLVATLDQFRPAFVFTFRDSFIIGAITNFFLDKISFSERALGNGTSILVADLTGFENERQESWVDWFARLIRQAKGVPTRESSLSVTARSVTGDGVTATDSPSIGLDVPSNHNQIGLAAVGFGEIA